MTDAEKEQIIASALNTSKGRRALARAMLAPLKRKLLRVYLPSGGSIYYVRYSPKFYYSKTSQFLSFAQQMP